MRQTPANFTPLPQVWTSTGPQAHYNKNNYKMSDFWGARYDPKYNNDGETNDWLEECVQ